MNKSPYLTIALFLLICLAAARIVTDVISYRLSALFPAAATATAAPVPQAAAADLSAYAPVVEKGLFGKATAGKLTPVAERSGPAAKAQAPAARPDLLVLGTAIGSFRETFALVQKPATHEERVFRLGDKVFDVGPLVAVHKESIEVSIGGKRTTFRTPSSPGESGGVPAPAMPAPPGGGLATQVGSGSYVIDQRGLNAALDNIGQAMTDARLLPSMKEGKVEGFRVSEVKPQGIFGTIGIRNGDVLLRVNDYAIDSPEKAVQSLASLKGQTRLKLDLIRDGQPTTFNYDIR